MKARQFIRYPTASSFFLAIDGMIGKHTYILQDAGQGGLCFNSLGCINLGTPLDLSFPLSDDAYHAKARVAWCKPLVKGHCSLGIVFEESVKQADIERIALKK